jgi:hypothetical protein
MPQHPSEVSSVMPPVPLSFLKVEHIKNKSKTGKRAVENSSN